MFFQSKFNNLEPSYYSEIVKPLPEERQQKTKAKWIPFNSSENCVELVKTIEVQLCFFEHQ